MKNKRVLFVAHVDSHIKAFHIPYLKLFKEYGYIVDVASNGNEQFDYCDHKYNICFQRNPLHPQNIKAYFALKKIINKNNYDIIHCHTPVGGVVARLANKNSKNYQMTRLIYTAHGFHFFEGNSKLNNIIFKAIEKRMAKYTDSLITINEEDYENAKKFQLKKNGKVYLVPGVGVNTQKIKDVSYDRKKFLEKLMIEEESILLLSVGELNSNKNQEVVIRGLSQLPHKYHYVMCGIGDREEELRELANELKVSDRIHFLGYRNDVYEIMKCCDIFIFPSKREGLPVSVMEAMACGMPCIVTDIRGNRDLIDCNQGGCVIGLDNFQEEFVNILLNESNKWDEMGKYNTKKVEAYSLNTIMKQMKLIYGLE